MFIIGVIGSRGKTATISSIYRVLQSRFKVNLLEAIDSKITTPEQLKEYIWAIEKSGTNALIVDVIHDSIEKGIYNNIDFDVIVHTTIEKEYYNSIYGLKDVSESENKLLTRLKSSSYVIINIDDDYYIDVLQGTFANVLTYGFNSKATVTASSVDDNDNRLAVCQQHLLKTLFNNNLEPQEFIINMKNYEQQNIYSTLAAVTTGLIFDVEKDVISENTF